jgi:outer membrane lipoprotein-sorting protein
MPDTRTGERTGRTLPLISMAIHRRGAATRGMRTSAVLCAISLSLSAAAIAGQKPPAAPPARPTFDELYNRGQKANANITTLTARFTETTTSALLERPTVWRGTLYVQRPSQVALHYSDPEGLTIVVDSNSMTRSWPSRKVLAVSDIGDAQKNVQKYFLASDARELRGLFDITLADASSRPGTYEVTMIPKRKQIRQGLARLDLWAAEASGLLQAMRMTFPNGETKLMEFTDVVPNAPIDRSVFSAPK